jgi:hypothetical protein
LYGVHDYLDAHRKLCAVFSIPFLNDNIFKDAQHISNMTFTMMMFCDKPIECV